MSKGNEIDSLQAKIVVLGDSRTGKSSLIRSLDPYCRSVSQSGSSGEQASFTVIEIPSNELDATASNVFLKFWEYTGSGVREQEVAFPGALFCIITIDMRAPETANSAFNKWMAMKEAHMPESFLFVVGTYLDFAAQRRIEIAEICKACAQKEAIYIEVSNLDGSNITLLRRLLCQRLNQMLKIRDDQKRVKGSSSGRGSAEKGAQSGNGADKGGGTDSSGTGRGAAASDDSKSLLPIDIVVDNISPSLIEKNILGHSVGSIYSSALFTSNMSEWEGFEMERVNLEQIGKRISSYIDLASQGVGDLAPADEYIDGDGTEAYSPRRYANDKSLSAALDADYSSYMPEPDAEEIRHLFDMMGLPLPPAMQIATEQSQRKKVSVKMKVRMPDSTHSYLTLRSGDNIENAVYQFVVGNDMLDIGAMDRLIDIGTQMLRKAEEDDLKQGQMSGPLGGGAASPSARGSPDHRSKNLGSPMDRDRSMGLGQQGARLGGNQGSPMPMARSSPHSHPQKQRLKTSSRSSPAKPLRCKARIQLPNHQVSSNPSASAIHSICQCQYAH
jgi:hypothetical protein